MLGRQVHVPDKEVIRDYHIGALMVEPIAVDRAASTRLVVNFFDGGPKSKVEVSIGGRSYRPLTKIERVDPFVVQVYARHSETKKPWVEAAKSTHVW